jgi:SPP1 gp7 family putative phage head morphogenesis protein
MTDAQEFAQLQKLTPAEAVAYLQRRGRLAVTYGWQDLWQEENAQQFTISRLTKADLLQSLQEMITRSVEGDLSRRDFERDARAALQKAGWWGTKEVIEPSTGEILRTTFDARRLQVIFDTNTRQAYAAGQWDRLQQTKRTHPYLRYITKRDERVRATHRAWDNVTLPVDDAFWATHYPPNGWRCRCRVVAVNQADYDKGVAPGGQAVKKAAPQLVEREWLNRRTGEVQRVPAGIDPGFGYNAGMARQRLMQRLVQDKLVALDAPIGAELWRELRSSMAPEQRQAWRELVDKVVRTKRASGATALVHVVDAATQQALREQNVSLASSAVLMRDSELLHAVRDTKLARGAALEPEQWAQLPDLLDTATPYLDTQDQALVYAIELPERAGKVVIRLNYTEKARFGSQRARVTANFVQTGGVVDADNTLEQRYIELKK